MKIGLISPKSRFLSNDPEFVNFWENTPESAGYRHYWSGFSSGLLTIAALLPKKYEIKIIDENYEDVNFNEGFDLVAISTMTQQVDRAYQIAREFMKRKTKVAIGGIHPTLLPVEAKEHADTVFVGEGEETWPRFIKDFKSNNAQPFYKSSVLVDLKTSPLPRFDLLNPDHYKMIWIQTTRGCPIDCEFCAASKIFGFKFRRKDIKHILEEIKLVKDIWKTPHINFADDNMFMDRKYSKKLINAISPLKIRWTAQTDISIADDDDLISLMRDAGCEILFIGFESLSKNNLANIDRQGWKFKRSDSYAFAINKIQAHGIGVMGAFMIGLDNDDISTFDKLIDFIIENNLFGAQVTISTPLPGTRLRERIIRDNRLLSKDWSNYTGFDVNFRPNKMTPEELQGGLRKIYKKIYSSDVRLRKLKHFKNIYLKLLTQTKTKVKK